MTKQEKAVALHKEGSNCAQSVLCAFTDELGIDTAQAHRLATGLGAGLGRRQHLCGAINGAAMVLGAAFGNETGADGEAKEKTYSIVQGFIREIEHEFNTLECSGLLGVDMNSEEGKAAYNEKNLKDLVCNKLIAVCAEKVERILKKG